MVRRLLLAGVGLVTLSETAKAQRYGDAPNWSELALGVTHGSTAAYDTTVTTLGVNGWVTWVPTVYSIGRLHLSVLINVELGWGKLSRALPYNVSETHELLVFGGGGGVSTQIGEDTEIGAHLYLDIQTDADYASYQVDAVEQWTLRLTGQRGALRARLSVPFKDQGFGNGSLVEAAVWRESPGRAIGLRLQRLSWSGGPETVTFISLMVGVPR